MNIIDIHGLSDDAIVDMLRESGVDIARRTVAKYREVREACLIANLDAERNADIGESARLLRTMSGLYDQAARAATSL